MDTPRVVCRRARVAAMVVASGAAIALTGCATKQAAMGPADPPLPFQPPARYVPGDRTVTAMLAGPEIPAGAGPQVVGKQRLESAPQLDPVEPSVVDGNVGELKHVKITVRGAGMEDIVRLILGPEGLGRSYVIDPTAMTGAKTVTLDIDEDMTRADMDDLLQGLAVLNGWTIEDRAGVTYIRPATTTAQNPHTPILDAQAAMGTEQPVIRMKRLQYVLAADAATTLKELQGTSGKVVQSGKSILIVDTASQANRLARVINALDVAPFAGVEVWTYELTSRTPENAGSILSNILTPVGITNSAGANTTDSAVAFVPIPDSSRLMVIARDPTVQTFVHDLIGQIDQPSDRVQRSRYIYRVQNYDTAELKKLLQDFFSDRMETAQGQSGTGSASGQNRAANGIRIVEDDKENLLLLYCTPEDYGQILGTLRTIDRPRQQVALTSIIAEVVLTNDLEYGVEYFLRAFDTDGLGILELAGGASDLITGTPTGSAVFTAADGFAVIQALQRESNVNILSQPNVTVMDGENALIKVGGQVPVTNGNIDTTTGGLRQDIDYKDTGIQLNITAEINEMGETTLKIEETIANVVSQSELGPEFTTRELNTTVVVPHGMTLLLGGIIQDDVTDNSRGIPILADIPAAGEAFKSRNRSKTRRELVLAITPKVINAPSDGQRVLSDFLRAAQGVTESLRDKQESLQRGVLYAPPPEGVSIQPPAEAPQMDPAGTPTGAAADVFWIDGAIAPGDWTVSFATPC